MIIKRLTLHNFGVYAGTNIFEFSHKKPIVLIGGMNGRGKTTFLDAVLLAVYGRNSKAYKESRYRSFEEYLRSFINVSDGTLSSSVEIELLMNESTNETYVINRSWNELQKRVREKISVEKNGHPDPFLTDNWTMFVESMIPSALSGFYFFDGEKIAELAVDQTGDQMKESIRSMLGISVLDILKNDLYKCRKKAEKAVVDLEIQKKIQTLREEEEKVQKALSETEQELFYLNETMDKLQKEIDELQIQCSVKGGDIEKKTEELSEKKLALQTELQTINDRLLNISADMLPLNMVIDLIQEIKLQAEDEHNDSVLREALEQIDLFYEEYANLKKLELRETKDFIAYLKSESDAKQTEPIYELSEHALFQVNDLLDSGLEHTVLDTKELISRKAALKKSLEETENYLAQPVDTKELKKIRSQIEIKTQKLQECRGSLSVLDQKRAEEQRLLSEKTAVLNEYINKYLENSEIKDDAERKMKYTSMAVKIIETYSVLLQKRKTETLASTITECYHKLANKKNMISKIIVDSETLEIRYLDLNNHPVNKASLSAGEKQLMVISILWALAICSQKCLPVIIDTPLSRLDSLHRSAMIKTYFPEASEQTIILSTDSEITEEYYKLMKENVGDEFTLVYDDKLKSTTVCRGYFGGKNDH